MPLHRRARRAQELVVVDTETHDDEAELDAAVVIDEGLSTIGQGDTVTLDEAKRRLSEHFQSTSP